MIKIIDNVLTDEECDSYMKCKHSVNKITKGVRYTLPIWYK